MLGSGLAGELPPLLLPNMAPLLLPQKSPTWRREGDREGDLSGRKGDFSSTSWAPAPPAPPGTRRCTSNSAQSPGFSTKGTVAPSAVVTMRVRQRRRTTSVEVVFSPTEHM